MGELFGQFTSKNWCHCRFCFLWRSNLGDQHGSTVDHPAWMEARTASGEGERLGWQGLWHGIAGNDCWFDQMIMIYYIYLLNMITFAVPKWYKLSHSNMMSNTISSCFFSFMATVCWHSIWLMFRCLSQIAVWLLHQTLTKRFSSNDFIQFWNLRFACSGPLGREPPSAWRAK